MQASVCVMEGDVNSLRAEIKNSAWLVRYYKRNRLRRAQAILRLGLAIREAFNSSDEFEVLILEILDGVSPEDRPRF